VGKSWFVVGARPVEPGRGGALAVRVERLSQPLGEVVGHLGGLFPELLEQGTDVTFVEAEVRGQILRTRDVADGSARNRRAQLVP
jgi:hypothetical protein